MGVYTTIQRKFRQKCLLKEEMGFLKETATREIKMVVQNNWWEFEKRS